MVNEVQKLVNGYVDWLKDKTTITWINEWAEITTPFLDRHNDYLQIYAKNKNGSYILSDDGYILNDLKQSGCDLDSNKRIALLKMTLNGFGIKLENSQLVTNATADNFAIKKHNLIQAMLAINDSFIWLLQ